MKILLAEDDFATRKFMAGFLSKYGECDGYQALMGIRNLEKERDIPADKAVKVIMTTALNEEKNVKMAFELGCTIYSGKPIDQERFEQAMKKLNLI